MKATLCTAAAVLLLTACGGGQPEPAAETPPPAVEPAAMGAPEVGKVARAANIARELRANPDGAEAILERHGMDAEDWGTLMVEIAADPAMSKAFQDALGGD